MADLATALPDFDPSAPAFRTDPFGTYRRYREESPVHLNSNGLYFVTRYEEVARVLTGGAVFIKEPAVALKQFRPGPFREHNRLSMTFMDEPDHGRVRRTVARYFTPRSLDALAPRIAVIADELLDAAGDRFDLMADYANPLPLYTICAMFGVDTGERAAFKRWSQAVVAGLEPGAPDADIDAADTAIVEFADFLGELADARRGSDGEDLISVLVREAADGRVSRDELIQNAAFLMNAGHETTAHLIGNSTKALFDHPDQLAALRAAPDRLDAAIEEMLRYDPPVQLTFRRTAEPVSLGDVEIPAGRSILAGIAAAGRDPAVFPDPDRFDIARAGMGGGKGESVRRHLAFAPGTHTCLGAALARLEGRIAFERLLSRAPELAPDGAPARNSGIIFPGFRTQPVRLHH